MKNSNDKTYNVMLDTLSMEALMEILLFAGNTSAFLAKKENEYSAASKEAIRLVRIANDCKDLAEYISDSLNLGEPLAHEIH